jgi:phenylacetic acid degradation operon negative regulatory protein
MEISFKKKILISASPMLDFLDLSKAYLPVPFWFFPNSFPRISSETVLNTLFKLEAEKLVKRSFLGRTKYSCLTSVGLNKLTEDIKFYSYMREKWDGKTRMVFFDIPETERKLRDETRFSLIDLGFVIWQRSVFISPHMVEAEVLSRAKKLGLEKQVDIILFDRLINRNVVDLLWSLYKLRSINERYNIFISQADHLLSSKISNYKRWVERCQELRFEYYDILTGEPFLPSGIIGDDYKFVEASGYFVELGKKLVTVLERV